MSKDVIAACLPQSTEYFLLAMSGYNLEKMFYINQHETFVIDTKLPESFMGFVELAFA